MHKSGYWSIVNAQTDSRKCLGPISSGLLGKFI